MKFLVFFSYILLLFSSKCKQDVEPLSDGKSCSDSCVTIYGSVKDTLTKLPVQDASIKLYFKGCQGFSTYLANVFSDSAGQYSVKFDKSKFNSDCGNYEIDCEKNGFLISPISGYNTIWISNRISTQKPYKANIRLFKIAYLNFKVKGTMAKPKYYYQYDYWFDSTRVSGLIYGHPNSNSSFYSYDTSFTLPIVGDINTRVGSSYNFPIDSFIVPAGQTKEYEINF